MQVIEKLDPLPVKSFLKAMWSEIYKCQFSTRCQLSETQTQWFLEATLTAMVTLVFYRFCGFISGSRKSLAWLGTDAPSVFDSWRSVLSLFSPFASSWRSERLGFSLLTGTRVEVPSAQFLSVVPCSRVPTRQLEINQGDISTLISGLIRKVRKRWLLNNYAFFI